LILIAQFTSKNFLFADKLKLILLKNL